MYLLVKVFGYARGETRAAAKFKYCWIEKVPTACLRLLCLSKMCQPISFIIQLMVTLASLLFQSQIALNYASALRKAIQDPIRKQATYLPAQVARIEK